MHVDECAVNESQVETFAAFATVSGVSTATQEIIQLCENLPPEKRAEVADFARFLLSRVEYREDIAWEQRLADPKPLPKLEKFLRESAAEGDEPLDVSRL